MSLYRKARPGELVLTQLRTVLTHAELMHADKAEACRVTDRALDRHKPGYMAAYMRKRRAK